MKDFIDKIVKAKENGNTYHMNVVEVAQLASVSYHTGLAHGKVMSELTEAAANDDTEAAHMDADNSLIEFIRALGFDDVVEAYDKVNKWYA